MIKVQSIISNKNVLRELYRIVSFGFIGIIQTIFSYILWNVLLYLCTFIGIDNTLPITISVTNFLSGFLLFSFSFVLHRRVTFKHDIPENESMMRSVLLFYGSYTFTALMVAIVTYISVSSINIAYLEITKVIITIFNAAANFLVQRLLIYKVKPITFVDSDVNTTPLN